MPNQEEEGEGDGEIGEELGVGGGHAVALAVHLYNRPVFSVSTLYARAVRQHTQRRRIDPTYVSASPP